MCPIEKVISPKITWFIMMFPVNIVTSLLYVQNWVLFSVLNIPQIQISLRSQGNLLNSSNTSGGAQQGW